MQETSDQVECLDRVLQSVVQKCKGGALTSKGVRSKLRHTRYILDGETTCSELVDYVLDRLIDGGLAEALEEESARRGRPVRRCRWKTWAAIKDNPASDAFRARLGLGEDDFA